MARYLARIAAESSAIERACGRIPRPLAFSPAPTLPISKRSRLLAAKQASPNHVDPAVQLARISRGFRLRRPLARTRARRGAGGRRLYKPSDRRREPGLARLREQPTAFVVAALGRLRLQRAGRRRQPIPAASVSDRARRRDLRFLVVRSFRVRDRRPDGAFAAWLGDLACRTTCAPHAVA